MATYRNPVIPGFHPDPSVCRVGDDYYLVTSSFEYFPGIPLYHSRDLVNWEQIGHCLDRSDQIRLTTVNPNGMGIFAPTIRHHRGRFYVTVTNFCDESGRGGNFLVWTDDIRGPWSDPVWIDLPGIDPSLYFEGDTAYYTGTDGEIFLCPIDPATGALLGKPQGIWRGTGGADPEGPHLYKVGSWYYLLISEGGTAQCHMITAARSRSVVGPYEACPRNPVLTNRSLPLPVRAVGHADLVEAQDGSWWAVCLGIRVVGYPDRHLLGRETFLVPARWDAEGWPRFGDDGSVRLEMAAPALPARPYPAPAERDDFTAPALGLRWNFIGNPVPACWSLTEKPGSLALRGLATGLSDGKAQAWVGRRQEHLRCSARTKLDFAPARDGEEAGLSIYLNSTHHYEIAIGRAGGERVVFFRRQIGSLWKVERQAPCPAGGAIELALYADPESYRFAYRLPGGAEVDFGRGEAQYLSTEAGGRFTGNYIALFAGGGGAPAAAPAYFDWFDYRPAAD